MIKSPSRPIQAIVLGSLLIVVCYFFVDRPVARFAHCHQPSRPGDRSTWSACLSSLPTFSDRLGNFIVAGIIGVVAWRVWRRGGRLQTLLLAIATSLAVTYAIKCLLKGVFGRTWPESWLGDNPSLIANGVYGFFPFHFDTAHGAFPSGHAAATFAVVSVLWLGWPRGRWLYGIVAGAICAALVALNYHFVGDVLAGAMLGSFVGFYTTKSFRLLPPINQTGQLP